MCFILRTCSLFRCPLRVLCCCLLSSVSGIDSLVRKSTQLTVHQEHTVLILHWTRQHSPVLDIHSSREIDQRNTECKMCFFLVTGSPGPVSVRISRDVFQKSCSRHSVSMQVSSGRDSVHVSLSKYLNTFLARVKSASVGDASLYDKQFVANIRSGLTPVMYCSFPTTALNNEC